MNLLRNIILKIKDFFTKKTPAPVVVEKPVAPVEKPKAPVSETPWMNVAKSFMGIDEVTNEDLVIMFHSHTDLDKSDRNGQTPWCSSFVTYCLDAAGYDSTHNAWARSYLDYGIKLDKPKYGCLVIYDRGNGNGHVHFFDHDIPGFNYGLGGNQSNEVNISAYAKYKVLGYRWPVKKS